MARYFDLDRPNLELDVALASGLALTKAMARASERVVDLAGAIERESTVDLDLDLARTHVYVILRVLNPEERHTKKLGELESSNQLFTQPRHPCYSLHKCSSK